jgi:hypothetical protein
MKKDSLKRELLKIKIEAAIAVVAFSAIVALVTYPVAEVAGHLAA